MGAVATFFYAALAAILLADVVGRELFGQGIFGAQRVAVFFTIIAGNFGLALAAAAGSHIRPRVADHWLPARLGPAMDRLADVITAIVLLGVAYFSMQLVNESFDFETVSPTIDWPIWPVQAVIPFGYGMAALHYLIFAIYPALRPQQVQISE
jgi:C4-dicarboxylate transporter DctQ subunit